jgi:uncharacterized heparinase superfamily protein
MLYYGTSNQGTFRRKVKKFMMINHAYLFYHSIKNTRVSQLFFRLKLHIKRILLSQFATNKFILNSSLAKDKEIYMASLLPKAIFKPRNKFVEEQANTLYIKFLNIKKPLILPMNWHPSEMKKGTRLWLLNLHYMEFLESIDDKDWFKYVKDWIKSNKPYMRGYWLDNWNSYSLSIRIVVWMQQFEKRGDSISQEDKTLFLKSLLAQVRFLRSNLELDIGGNHLIKNIKALLWAHRFFEGKEAKSWYSIGLKLLNKNLDEQITKDGVHYELSPAYHAQVFADLMECYVVIDDITVKEKLRLKLSKMAQFLADTTHPDSMVSLFNDSGLHMTYQPSELLDTYKKMFNIKIEPDDIISYENAGYFGLRYKNNLVLFDAAELAAKYLPAHGHGDALSFEWSVFGQRVIINPGVFEYDSGKFRDLSRSTKSHNTVTLDNHDQSEFWKSFRVGRRANIINCNNTIKNDSFTVNASHNGFTRLSKNPIHNRKISMYKNKIKIEDSIEKGNGQDAVARIMLAPDISVEMNDSNCFLLGKGFSILVESDNKISLKEAWCFLDFGHCQKTTQLIIEFGKAPCKNKFSLSIL